MKEKVTNLLLSKSGVFDNSNFHCYYEVLVNHHNWNKKQFLGDDFVCRFCGETSRTQFKKGNAHTFPESTGNKWLFSKDECKKCNDKFSHYENELLNHGHLTRTLFGIKTKENNYPKIKNKAKKMSLTRDTSGFKMMLNFKCGEQTQSESDGKIVFNLDFEKNLNTAEIAFPEKEYIPLYLFKALAKIAFSIMPKSELETKSFERYKTWLTNKDDSFEDDNYKPFFYVYHNRMPFIEREPLLILFKKGKQYNTFNIPTYSFFFTYGNLFFQIFLPYFSGDSWLNEETEIKLPIIPELVLEKDQKGHFIWMNGHSKEKVKYKDFEFSVSGRVTHF